jgi:hypothetical protein
MYLWNRQFVVSPARFWEGLEAISTAVAYSNSNSDYDFNIWLPAGVGTLGAVGISSQVVDFAPFADEMAARAADPEFQALGSAIGPCLAQNPEDILNRIAHVAGDRGDVPAVSALIGWQAHPADLKKAIGFAVEMAEYQHGVHGHTVAVGTSMWGTPNGITMIASYDSVAEFEAASDAIQAEGSFLDRMEAGAVGRAETIQSWVMRRII